MIYVQVADAPGFDSGMTAVERTMLERAASQALQFAGQEADLTLVLTGDERLRELNRQFLGVDAPTDVLAFPAGETDPDSQILYLGDVIISYPRAEEQSTQAGHPVADELQLLVVHGVLHLLGYDHAVDGEKAVMWAAQRKILERLGLEITL